MQFPEYELAKSPNVSVFCHAIEGAEEAESAKTKHAGAEIVMHRSAKTIIVTCLIRIITTGDWSL
jgi:hypothetical protein